MTQHHLTVSVLISTYNRANLLPEALDSLLAQTRVPDEIIVVDDGSTDNTAEVLARYGSPVRVIRQQNKGLPNGRNTGLQNATGDLITFLDSDDILPIDSISCRLNYLETHADSAAVYGATHMTDMQNHFLDWYRKPPLPHGNLFAESACRVVFPMHSIMFRRICLPVVGLFDESLSAQIDLDYWIRFSATYSIDSINEVVAYYRVHEGMSVLTDSEDVLQQGILVQKRVFSMPAFHALSPRQRARVYNAHGMQHIQVNDRRSALYWYLKSIRDAPLYIRPYMFLLLTPFGKAGYRAFINLYRRLQRKSPL